MLINAALGKNYEQAIPVLRAMLLAVPPMACNQMLASQGLLPLGLEKIQAQAQGIAACASLPLAAFLAWHTGISGCAWLPLIIEIIICPFLWHGLWENGLKNVLQTGERIIKFYKKLVIGQILVHLRISETFLLCGWECKLV